MVPKISVYTDDDVGRLIRVLNINNRLCCLFMYLKVSIKEKLLRQERSYIVTYAFQIF